MSDTVDTRDPYGSKNIHEKVEEKELSRKVELLRPVLLLAFPWNALHHSHKPCDMFVLCWEDVTYHEIKIYKLVFFFVFCNISRKMNI